MKNLLTTTALATSLAFAPMHESQASDFENSELKKWCEQDGATMTICGIGFLAGLAIILAVADGASSNRPVKRSYSSSSDDSGTIAGGNASPENHSPDPTPEYSLPEVEPQYDVNEQGLAWGSRKDGTAH